MSFEPWWRLKVLKMYPYLKSIMFLTNCWQFWKYIKMKKIKITSNSTTDGIFPVTILYSLLTDISVKNGTTFFKKRWVLQESCCQFLKWVPLKKLALKWSPIVNLILMILKSHHSPKNKGKKILLCGKRRDSRWNIWCHNTPENWLISVVIWTMSSILILKIFLHS